MTSEPDSTPRRRPPTIDLTATGSRNRTATGFGAKRCGRGEGSRDGRRCGRRCVTGIPSVAPSRTRLAPPQGRSWWPRSLPASGLRALFRRARRLRRSRHPPRRAQQLKRPTRSRRGSIKSSRRLQAPRPAPDASARQPCGGSRSANEIARRFACRTAIAASMRLPRPRRARSRRPKPLRLRRRKQDSPRQARRPAWRRRCACEPPRSA